MDNDDRQVGRILSRREVLALFGAAGAAVLAGCAAPSTGTQASGVGGSASPSLNAEAASAVAVGSDPAASASASASAAALEATNAAVTTPGCVVIPELTEGPYFIDEQLNRSDIRVEPGDNSVRAGVPIAITVNVSQISSTNCAPLQGAIVDIWQCDAEGVYAGVENAVGQKFLRGYQVTDANGVAQFTTIYPGWYRGRTVHIHFKVRTQGADEQDYEFTSQMFFDDALTDQVYTQEPYASRRQRDTLNSDDGIYAQGSEQLVLALTPTAEGYATTFNIGLDLSDTEVGADDGGGGRGGPPRR